MENNKDRIKPGVEIDKKDWQEMRRIAKEKGMLAWSALAEAVKAWNKKHSK